MPIEQNSPIKTFFIYANKWCPRRSIDASKLFNYFVKNDLKASSSPNKADLIVIYTCGVFSLKEEASIRTIENSLNNKSAKIVVTGCLLKINPEKLTLHANTLLLPMDNFSSFDSLIIAKVPYSEIPLPTSFEKFHDLIDYADPLQKAKKELNSAELISQKIEHFFSKHSINYLIAKTTYKIEIARGCLSDCAFCAIKQANKEFYSHPEDQIVASFRAGLKKGYKDFALLANDIGCYGLDINPNLPSLTS
jgi:tRNA A37 methylthiotransferase MiaB